MRKTQFCVVGKANGEPPAGTLTCRRVSLNAHLKQQCLWSGQVSSSRIARSRHRAHHRGPVPLLDGRRDQGTGREPEIRLPPALPRSAVIACCDRFQTEHLAPMYKSRQFFGSCGARVCIAFSSLPSMPHARLPVSLMESGKRCAKKRHNNLANMVSCGWA